VVVLSRPVEQRILDLLRQCGVKPHDSLAPTPIVIIDDGVEAQGTLRRSDLASIVVSRRDVRIMLRDAITRECARATLAFAKSQVGRIAEIHSLLQRALFTLFDCEQVLNSVRELARVLGVNDATLYHYWNRDGLQIITGMSLKGFVDVVALLKVRYQRDHKSTWNDVAIRHRTTARRLQDCARRIVGTWPGDRNHIAWLQLGRRVQFSFQAPSTLDAVR
jgi:hypothetical protein